MRERSGGRTRSTSSYFRFITAGRWELPTENERHARRLGSTVAELRTFYDAVLPRIDAMLAYLNDFRWIGADRRTGAVASIAVAGRGRAGRLNYSSNRRFPMVMTPGE